jgi:hypothetical protein
MRTYIHTYIVETFTRIHSYTSHIHIVEATICTNSCENTHIHIHTSKSQMQVYTCINIHVSKLNFKFLKFAPARTCTYVFKHSYVPSLTFRVQTEKEDLYPTIWWPKWSEFMNSAGLPGTPSVQKLRLRLRLRTSRKIHVHQNLFAYTMPCPPYVIYTHTCIHATYMHARMHTYIQTLPSCAYIHAHTRTNMHTHRKQRPSPSNITRERLAHRYFRAKRSLAQT